MSSESWKASHVRCLGVHLIGGHIDVDEYGTPIIGDHLLILFNADHEQDIPFSLPKVSTDCGPWERLFDTALDTIDADPPKAKGEEIARLYKVLPCSMVVFRALVPREGDSLTGR